MQRKKYITLKARKIRKTIKGVNLPLSIKLAQLGFYQEIDFIRILKEYGFQVEEIIEGYCTDDGDPYGYLLITKDGKEMGKVDFTCCGICIKV